MGLKALGIGIIALVGWFAGATIYFGWEWASDVVAHERGGRWGLVDEYDQPPGD
jgi:hypothetical protein